MVSPTVKRDWEGITGLQGQMLRALWSLNCLTGEGAVMGEGIAIWMTGHWSSYRSKALQELVDRGFVEKFERSVFGRTPAFYYSLSEAGAKAVTDIWIKADQFSYTARKPQTSIMAAIEF